MNFAIIGASGNVGRKTIEILEKSKIQFKELFLVASAKSAGKKIKFRDKEIKVEVDLHRMEMSQVSFRDIEDAISFENTSIAGGDVLIGDTRRMVRTSAEFTSAEEIANHSQTREG